MNLFFSVGRAILVTAFVASFASSSFASSVTIREVELKGNSTEILLDSAISRDMVQIDYVRDIVQFSINNATIYPAKMLHASNASYTKVFAYQYSPSLVRVRFTVEGNAELFKGKVKWEIEGKRFVVHFASPAAVAADDERSLLEKITGATTVEKIDEKTKQKLENAKVENAKSENQPVSSNKKAKLGGAKPGPSLFRSFLAMILVVGGLGLLLLYVKRKNAGGVQAKKVSADSWYSKFLPKNIRKQKSLMEVVATHVLGPKQSIVVMKIRGQQFVLAVTADNIQLITQLDSDEADLDLLDDPKVAASIGKMFGAPAMVINNTKSQSQSQSQPAQAQNQSEQSFSSLLRNSTGASAIVARNAYSSQQSQQAQPQVTAASVGNTSVRDQIKRRLEGRQ